MRVTTPAAVLLVTLWACNGSRAPVDWPTYAHDAGGSKFSPATAVTADNVKTLVPVWTYRTGDYALGDGMARDETTPLFVDDVLYASTPFGGVRALNGETGDELWSFDAGLDFSGNYGDFTNRGVATWVDPTSAANTACRRRIYVAPVDARIIALDARTGARCAGFGTNGEVSLNHDLVNAPTYTGEYSITSPPAVINGMLIVGSTVSDSRRAESPAGVVRALDARTGALKWAWDPVPRTARDSGYDTWRGPIAHRTGAANAWALMSVDSVRDLVFVPTGSASPDFFGGERLGQNLYANSVVALRASTGAMVWHFQMVHHDLWDYDVASEPALVTVHRDGRDIPAVVQVTKMGHMFVLNRDTGVPLFPVEERAVPRSDVTGEEAWPTQPFPTAPAPLAPSAFAPDSVFALSDAGRAWCRTQLEGARSEGIFTPPSLRGTVIYPGNVGGSNWSGVAIDPARHIAVVPSNRIVTVVDLVPRAATLNRAAAGTRFNEYGPQTGTAYAMRRQHLVAPDGVPCNPPPWGTLTAVDFETGQKVWERPMGRIAALDKVSGSDKWGSPNLGGAMITAGGLVFAGGALDQSLHAYSVATGDELWSAHLPAGVHASPMTYVTKSGRQFVVVAAGGHKELHDKAGDYVIAFALPGAPAQTTTAPRLTAGHFEGQMLLDRTRFPAAWDVKLDGASATVTFTISDPHIVGTGMGRVHGDTLVADLHWTFAAKNCSGTMHVSGEPANGNRLLVGEIEYFDGCADQRTKTGTFAVRRTTLPRQ